MSRLYEIPMLEPSVIWTQIRAFIKGSIEAVIKGSPISKEQYLDFNVFPIKRCRLSASQRELAYTIYEAYDKLLEDNGLWDDTQRVSNILVRSNLLPLGSCNGNGGDFDKIYVDEV